MPHIISPPRSESPPPRLPYPGVRSNLDLKKLNAPQRDAVLHGNGPLLVLAGAGSGKTSTMSYRIAHLVAERQQSGSSILGLSFTRKAAGELKERVSTLVVQAAGRKAAEGLTLTTFHSLCVRILRTHAPLLGYSKNFTILDQTDQTDTIRTILKNIHVDDRKFDPMSLLFEIGQAKNRFLSGDEAMAYFEQSGRLGGAYVDVISSVYPQYVAQLKALDSVDFDDLLFLAARLLREHADIRQGYGLRFKHILVDEYQDTNPAQFQLLRMLTESHQNICVVGDDDQSIYGWRGADARHILEFSNHYPKARTITLDQNYRSTSRILDAANLVISQNRHRHPKQLWSTRGEGEPIQMVVLEEDRAEAEFVAEEILKHARTNVEGQTTQLRPWKDFAVLYRSNPQSRVFEEALRMRKIPYKLVGALSFLDRKEVKDLFSYFRVVANLKDDASLRRILNWPARGLGRTVLEAVSAHGQAHHVPVFEALEPIAAVTPRAAPALRQFMTLIHELRADLEKTPAEAAALSSWGKRVLERIGAREALVVEHSDDPKQAVKKLENLEEFVNALGQLDIADLQEEVGTEPLTAPAMLREFLSRMLLQAQAETDDKKKDAEKNDQDQVTLLTLHGSKGLEYPLVFLVGLEDGLLPHRRTIEEAQDFSEERRLFYVGMTRAKDRLYLTRARTRIRYGKAVPRIPSRFLNELPMDQLLHQNLALGPDHESVSPVAREAAEKKHEERVSSFLANIRAQIASPKGPRPV